MITRIIMLNIVPSCFALKMRSMLDRYFTMSIYLIKFKETFFKSLKCVRLLHVMESVQIFLSSGPSRDWLNVDFLWSLIFSHCFDNQCLILYHFVQIGTYSESIHMYISVRLMLQIHTSHAVWLLSKVTRPNLFLQRIRKPQYKDVYMRTIEMPQHARLLG